MPYGDDDTESQKRAHRPAEQRQQHRLDQKLHQNVALARANGHPNTDLARSLDHRNEHDVHDSDPTDQKRYRSHSEQQDREGAVDRLLRGAKLRLRSNHEVGLTALADVVALPKDTVG